MFSHFPIMNTSIHSSPVLPSRLAGRAKLRHAGGSRAPNSFQFVFSYTHAHAGGFHAEFQRRGAEVERLRLEIASRRNTSVSAEAEAREATARAARAEAEASEVLGHVEELTSQTSQFRAREERFKKVLQSQQAAHEEALTAIRAEADEAARRAETADARRAREKGQSEVLMARFMAAKDSEKSVEAAAEELSIAAAEAAAVLGEPALNRGQAEPIPSFLKRVAALLLRAAKGRIGTLDFSAFVGGVEIIEPHEPETEEQQDVTLLNLVRDVGQTNPRDGQKPQIPLRKVTPPPENPIEKESKNPSEAQSPPLTNPEPEPQKPTEEVEPTLPAQDTDVPNPPENTEEKPEQRKELESESNLEVSAEEIDKGSLEYKVFRHSMMHINSERIGPKKAIETPLMYQLRTELEEFSKPTLVTH